MQFKLKSSGCRGLGVWRGGTAAVLRGDRPGAGPLATSGEERKRNLRELGALPRAGPK